jgi:hypothetical protein
MLARIGLVAVGLLAFVGSVAVAVPGGAGNEIPPKFRGAGCNLKYGYTRTPKADASECIAAKAGRKDGDAHDNDNFIRITAGGVAGVEWGCTVKSIKAATDTEFTFVGECSDEGSQGSASTVTLLLRPGKVVIVDQVTEGRHIIDIYHILDGLH